ncbi:MAG: aminoacyl-tRNA hydrolase [Ilumatobacteraceae bacterium]|jgi:PTH1 family peptidyl-tRNA hydrolase|nr:aminoacyl-tRNA hydrolase [Ilumatobacteraceae bacterium]
MADIQRTLVVGLGNPGKRYARTRHNVGQEAVELLAERCGARLKVGKQHALIAETSLIGTSVVLAVPTTYMNDSGEAVGPLCKKYKIDDLAHLIIVHDELDLEPGALRVKVGGGLAGHNGLRSISAHLKSDDYVRVRIGVGKPRSKEAGADHVLSRIPASERQLLDECVVRAADAVEAILRDGALAAMTAYNAKPA